MKIIDNHVILAVLTSFVVSACGGAIPEVDFHIAPSAGPAAPPPPSPPVGPPVTIIENVHQNGGDGSVMNSGRDFQSWLGKFEKGSKPMADVREYEETMGALYKAKHLPAEAKNVAIPASYLAGGQPTVRGDPEITMTNGEKIHYTGPATFVIVDAERGLKALLHVDVRPPADDYISSVWRYSYEQDQWRHLQIPQAESTRDVPLSPSAALHLSGPPPTGFIPRFRRGVTWLVLGGNVVPGPDYDHLMAILRAPREELRGQLELDESDLARRNVLAFAVTLAHFRSEGLHPCDHLRGARAAQLLAGFMWTYYAR
ncbi:MAG: hypothetical protein IT372_28030 [Polyangiaceae bacterium]|nr:hypothetical protein [Polyangiaceae bacterium]